MSKHKRTAWTEEDIQWLKEHYSDPTVDPFTRFPNRTKAAIYCMASYNLGLTRPVVTVPHSRCDLYKEEIVACYLRNEEPSATIAARYRVSTCMLTKRLKEWGVYDPKRKRLFFSRKSAQTRWLEQFGEEEAERRNKLAIERRSTSLRRGAQHHWFGKAPPFGCGRGLSGHYRGHRFRSLMEATYMIQLDNEKVTWSSAEHIRIPYELEGKTRSYLPDFLVGDKMVELKPKCHQNNPKVVAKRRAAEAYCLQNGLTYEMFEVPVSQRLLRQAFFSGHLTIIERCRDRFLAHVRIHSG